MCAKARRHTVLQQILPVSSAPGTMLGNPRMNRRQKSASSVGHELGGIKWKLQEPSVSRRMMGGKTAINNVSV